MNSKNKTIIGIVALVLIIGMAYIAYSKLSGEYTAPPQDEQTQNNEDHNDNTNEEEQVVMAEDFIVYDTEGNEVKLSDFLGKPVVLNFWASWCDPCKDEMPNFELLFNEYGEDVVFLMVNSTDGARETEDIANEFIEQNGYTFPIYFDLDGYAVRAYGVNSIPITYFIDERGVIKYTYRGTIIEEYLRFYVEDLINIESTDNAE